MEPGPATGRNQARVREFDFMSRTGPGNLRPAKMTAENMQPALVIYSTLQGSWGINAAGAVLTPGTILRY
jgi:hypothetical protein